jgi:hypothetical protein
MKLTVGQGVLAVLVLINFGCLVYLISKVKELTMDIDSQYQQLLNSFTFITKQIKQIPKEITVKNVLNIP